MAEKYSSKTTMENKPKGILKHTSSLDDQSIEVHWDEMNILQTYHPAGKDYGHMKIEEPPTPYNYRSEDSDTEEHTQLDPQQLAENRFLRMKNVPTEGHKSPEMQVDESSSDEEVTPEQEEIVKEFKDKRKHHYNEYSSVKLARELIEKELAELEDENQQKS